MEGVLDFDTNSDAYMQEATGEDQEARVGEAE
jgi:hypothetical protein